MNFLGWVIIGLFLIGCFTITFLAFHGELVLKCPSCKKRFTFKRAVDPLELVKNKEAKPEILDDVQDLEIQNSIVCQNCGYTLVIGK